MNKYNIKYKTRFTNDKPKTITLNNLTKDQAKDWTKWLEYKHINYNLIIK